MQLDGLLERSKRWGVPIGRKYNGSIQLIGVDSSMGILT